MKIGIDARLYQETGVGRYISNLISKLYQIDQENEYVVFVNDNAFDRIPVSNKWKVVQTQIHWHSFSEQIKFPLILARWGLDIVHFPYFSIPILYPGKFVTTIHDVTNLNYVTGKASTLPVLVYKLKHLAYQFILKTAIQRAGKIIVPSNETGLELMKTFPGTKKKIIVTYEGGFEKINYQSKKLELEPFFLYVGNVYPHKNLEKGILAIQKLNFEQKTKIKLAVVGKEDFFLRRLKSYIKEKKLEKDIIFLGKVNDYKLSNLYGRAVCLFFPSLSEGFGLPALEAMQHGCLIACSDLPVFHEICGKLPFYFDPNDVNDIKQTLRKIISLSENEKALLSIKEKKHSRKFSWETMAKQTLAAYEEVLR